MTAYEYDDDQIRHEEHLLIPVIDYLGRPEVGLRVYVCRLCGCVVADKSVHDEKCGAPAASDGG